MIIRMLALVAIATGSVLAAEPDESSTDDALLRKLLGESEQALPATDGADPADSAVRREPAGQVNTVDTQAVVRIVAELRAAEEGLAARQTGEATQSAQARAIDELARLIEAAKKQRSRSPSDSSSESQSSQPTGSQSSAGEASSSPSAGPGSTAGQAQANRQGKADESSDRVPGSQKPNDVVRDFRFEIVRDAWGHLPPRLRDQILNAGSDRYLPEYDSLVRRYFESLAQPNQPAEPRP